MKKKAKKKKAGGKAATSPKGANPKPDEKPADGKAATSPKGANPKPDEVQVEQAAPEPPKPKLKGEVTVRYNHYSEKMNIEQTEGEADGTILAGDIVEALALDFAFQGSFVTHLNKSSRLARIDRLWFQPETGMVTGLQIGEEYYCDIDEDEVAEAAVVRTAYVPVEKKEPLGGKREEGCSCLFGNPCMESYTCKNWQNRFEVAKANGWKGYS